MPTQGVQYRAPHNIQDESLLDMVMTGYGAPRPPRPNSIELRRSYPPEEQHLYSPPSSDHYRLKFSLTLQILIQGIIDYYDQQYFFFLYRVANFVAQGYEENLYGSHYGSGQGQAGSETYQSPGGQSTPSRGGRSRPSQPPPAPPSNTSSNSTPTVASANNTPTRGRSMSTGRDTLPPPPPPPGETMSPPPMNGNNSRWLYNTLLFFQIYLSIH